jgi:hypothetical protein
MRSYRIEIPAHYLEAASCLLTHDPLIVFAANLRDDTIAAQCFQRRYIYRSAVLLAH